MTKSEILDKVSLATCDHTDFDGVYKAMDEYAKQQVMDFIEWVQQHHRSTDTPSTWLILGRTGWLTNDQILSQFIEQQSKEQ